MLASPQQLYNELVQIERKAAEKRFVTEFPAIHTWMVAKAVLQRETPPNALQDSYMWYQGTSVNPKRWHSLCPNKQLNMIMVVVVVVVASKPWPILFQDTLKKKSPGHNLAWKRSLTVCQSVQIDITYLFLQKRAATAVVGFPVWIPQGQGLWCVGFVCSFHWVFWLPPTVWRHTFSEFSNLILVCNHERESEWLSVCLMALSHCTKNPGWTCVLSVYHQQPDICLIMLEIEVQTQGFSVSYWFLVISMEISPLIFPRLPGKIPDYKPP